MNKIAIRDLRTRIKTIRNIRDKQRSEIGEIATKTDIIREIEEGLSSIRGTIHYCEHLLGGLIEEIDGGINDG